MLRLMQRLRLSTRRVLHPRQALVLLLRLGEAGRAHPARQGAGPQHLSLKLGHCWHEVLILLVIFCTKGRSFCWRRRWGAILVLGMRMHVLRGPVPDEPRQLALGHHGLHLGAQHLHLGHLRLTRLPHLLQLALQCDDLVLHHAIPATVLCCHGSDCSLCCGRLHLRLHQRLRLGLRSCLQLHLRCRLDLCFCLGLSHCLRLGPHRGPLALHISLMRGHAEAAPAQATPPEQEPF
mmetsp:Transcript_41903/g.119583  ORF Transcript_41903/g.119583 Transcript_41903/m.119583 type:complete len:235 (-) Transcript_41903:212-916(-)